MKVEERTPLQWPEGFPRTKSPTTSRFDRKTIPQAVDEVVDQLRLLGAESCTLTANAFLRSKPVDTGVAVFFKMRTGWDAQRQTAMYKNFVVPCDAWNSVEHNFWAIGKHIEAMRGQRRWGCGSLERDFMGYAALPEKTTAHGPWHEVLGVDKTASKTLITEAYRQKAKIWHPDIAGGSVEKMAALNRAYDEAMR